MKCPKCHNLNAATDTNCYRCGRSLQVVNEVEPLWTYFFAVACGIIPVLTVGGFIPILVGCGGAGGCLTVGRWSSIPTPIRMVFCLGITLGCWIVVGSVLLAVLGMTRR